MKTEYSLLGQTDDLPDQSNVDLSTTVGNVDRGGYRGGGIYQSNGDLSTTVGNVNRGGPNLGWR